MSVPAAAAPAARDADLPLVEAMRAQEAHLQVPYVCMYVCMHACMHGATRVETAHRRDDAPASRAPEDRAERQVECIAGDRRQVAELWV